jgi:DivIVA domain-containing protein
MTESRTATENGNSEAKAPERPSRRYPGSRSNPDRERLLHGMREIQFPAAMRGYDRTAVDRYVTEVNRVIAELEISSSPEAAVRHALDEVSEETRELLQRAHATAEEITARSRSKADDRLQQAEAEAGELRAGAVKEAEQTREVAAGEAQQLREAAAREAQQLRGAAQREADELRASARREADELLESAEVRARELARSAENLWRERRRLLEDMRQVADQLVAIGEAEGGRFNQFDPGRMDGTSEAVVAPE